jgi:Na+/melibiose symporter-like transporter
MSFLLSTLVLAAGTLGYVGLAHVGAGLGPFMAASVILGLGFTFYSGAVEAWLVDALTATGYRGGLDSVFARGAMVTGAAMLVGTVGGGLLGSIDLAVPYLARSAALLAAFGVAVAAMRDLGFERRRLALRAYPAEMGRIARDSVTFGWQHRPVRLLILISTVEGVFLIWGFYAWQPYFLELLGRDAIWVAGVVAALIALSTIVGNVLVEWLTRFCGKRTTLMLAAAVVQAAAIVGVGVVDSFWLAVAFLITATGALGLLGPVRQAFLHSLVPSSHRATVVSFDSMVASGGGVAGQAGLGYLSREQSIASGYVVSGAILGLMVPVAWVLRRLGDPADVIIGDSAGCSAPAAGQGLTSATTVDAEPRQPVGG